MSITSEIERIQGNIESMYDSLEAMGVQVPAVRNSNNLVLTVDSTVPRIPINCAGLSMWLDGDCNTRTGLDRTKKYFENLVWHEPFEKSLGNLESFENSGVNNVWVDNRLKLVDYACYPYIGSDLNFTYEIVIKKLENVHSNVCSASCYKNGKTDQSKAYTIDLSSGSVYIWMWDNQSEKHGSVSISCDLNSVSYITITYLKSQNLVTIKNHSKNVQNTGTKDFTGSIYNFNFGLAGPANSESTERPPHASYQYGIAELGMLRYWSRVLTDDELQANYLDAKKRFGCV